MAKCGLSQNWKTGDTTEKSNNIIHYIKNNNNNLQVSLDAGKSLKTFNIHSR